MNKTESNKEVALKWIKAFNDHDLNTLLSLYAEDAVHYSPKLKSRQPTTQGWIFGKPQLAAWWRDAFDRLPNLHYQLENLISNEYQVLMEYVRKVPLESDILIAEILEIDDGLIFKSRVYHG